MSTNVPNLIAIALVASWLLVAMPGAPNSFLFLVVRPGAYRRVLLVGAELKSNHCQIPTLKGRSLCFSHKLSPARDKKYRERAFDAFSISEHRLEAIANGNKGANNKGTASS